jgi:integrase
MARARQKPSGKWEIGLRHPSLPGGRRYFTFDTEADATAYAQQWKLMKLAGLQPPAELLQVVDASPILAVIIRQWANSGLPAPTQQITLRTLVHEVGSVKLSDATYAWLSAYVQRLKVGKNLAPGSIRQRVQALGRCIDEWARRNPSTVVRNPVRLLPKGYSAYSDVDRSLAEAAGKRVKVDTARDRRLHPGEQERIVAALSGHQREDRERGLMLTGGNALLTMFLLIVYSGLRLREAYTLTRGQVDLITKVMRVQSTKQWRGKVAFRDVPMRPEVHRALTAYLSTRSMLPGARLFPFMEEEPGLSLTRVSARLSARYTTAFAYAGCKDLREHDLRHEATCRWLEMRDATGNWMFRLEEVNRIMGWAAGSTMAQRYASFRGSDLAQRMWATDEPAAATPARPGGGA